MLAHTRVQLGRGQPGEGVADVLLGHRPDALSSGAIDRNLLRNQAVQSLPAVAAGEGLR